MPIVSVEEPVPVPVPDPFKELESVPMPVPVVVPVPVPLFIVFIVSVPVVVVVVVVVESDVPVLLPELLQLNDANAMITTNNTRLMVYNFLMMKILRVAKALPQIVSNTIKVKTHKYCSLQQQHEWR